jgi:hypothetical protein
VVAEAARFPKLGATFYQHGQQEGGERLAAYFAECDARGKLHVANPRMAADQFLGMINNVRLPVLLGLTKRIEKSALEGWLEFSVELFLKGVEPRR